MEDGAKGNANQAIGKAKTSLGDLTGNEKLAAEGEAQQVQGGLQKVMGDVKQKASDVAEAISKPFKENDDTPA